MQNTLTPKNLTEMIANEIDLICLACSAVCHSSRKNYRQYCAGYLPSSIHVCGYRSPVIQGRAMATSSFPAFFTLCFEHPITLPNHPVAFLGFCDFYTWTWLIHKFSCLLNLFPSLFSCTQKICHSRQQLSWKCVKTHFSVWKRMLFKSHCYLKFDFS